MANPKPTAGAKRAAAKKKAVPAKTTGRRKAASKAVAKPRSAAKKAPTRAVSSKTAARGAKKPTPKAAAPKKAPAVKKRAPATARAKAAPAKAPAKASAKKGAAKASTKATPATAAPAAPPEAKTAVDLMPKVPPRKAGSVICPLSGWEVMPAKPGLSDRTLKRLRARLVDEREQQLRQAEELAAEAEELAQERDPGDTQFDEESGEGDTINVERERDLLLSATARQIVEAIDRALARMDARTYGLCLPAGRKLSLERLEAIPYAEECVDCKARAERRR